MMRFGRQAMWLGLALGLACMQGSCRELASVLPEDAPTAGPVRVLDEDGEPLEGARIEFYDGFRKSYPEETIRWSGIADANGTVHPDVPVGQYRMRVETQGGNRPGLWEQLVDLDPGPKLVDPRPWLFEGRLEWPGGRPDEDWQLRASFRAEYRSGDTVWLDARGNLDESGEFRIVLATDAPVRMEIQSPSLDWKILDEEPVPRGEPFVAVADLVPVELELWLGGEPLPVAELRVEADGGDLRTDFDVVVATWFGFLAPRGPCEVRISPRGTALHFFSREIWIDAVPDGRATVDLGEHRLDLRAFTTSGAQVFAGGLEIGFAEQPYGPTFPFTAPATSVYLRPGQYWVRAELEEVRLPIVLVDVDQDLSIELVFPDP